LVTGVQTCALPISILTAPGMCPPSYAVVSSSTSTKTTPGDSRFFSAQSAETSAVSRLIDSLPWMGGGESAHGGFVAPRAGPRLEDLVLVRRRHCRAS